VSNAKLQAKHCPLSLSLLCRLHHTIDERAFHLLRIIMQCIIYLFSNIIIASATQSVNHEGVWAHFHQGILPTNFGEDGENCKFFWISIRKILKNLQKSR